MARPRTAPGTWGRIVTSAQVVDSQGRWREAAPGEIPGRYRARTKIRDLDGALRDIQRYDAGEGRRRPSAAAAERALKSALKDRVEPRRGLAMTREMTLAAAGAVWLDSIARSDAGISPNTRDQYRAAWRRYVEMDPFAQHSLAEANRVPPIREFLRRIADTRGTGAAKTTRTVVSLVIGQAVNEGLFEINATRHVAAPKRNVEPAARQSGREARLQRSGFTPSDIARDTDRAFTWDERTHVVGFALYDDAAQAADVGDLIAFLAATGARISEALALRWDDVKLAGAEGTTAPVHLRGTKTEHSDRVVHLPGWAADVMRRRFAFRPTQSGLVFPSPRSDTRRDRRNATRSIRSVLDRAGYPWASPHTFRRTVASILDAQGAPLATIADVLGHADPSMTAREYLGRKTDTSSAAALL